MEGWSLLLVCVVVFCSDSDNPGLAVVGKVVFVGLVLVNIWCSVGGAEIAII